MGRAHTAARTPAPTEATIRSAILDGIASSHGSPPERVVDAIYESLMRPSITWTRTPAPGGAALTFAELAAANASRCAIWHPGGLDEWSVADWAVAMAGEAGEVCNAVKKLRRVEGDTVGANGPTTREAAIEAIAQEIADTAIYLDLLAQRIGIRLEDCVVAKFNKVSEREGFPHRLTALLQEGTGA